MKLFIVLLPLMIRMFRVSRGRFEEEFKGVPFGKELDNKCSVPDDADVTQWMQARSGALSLHNCKV